MNNKTLYMLEDKFVSVYVDGFQSEELKKIGKKHNIGKLVEYTREVCSFNNLERGLMVLPNVVKIVTKSSMVSVFEKMRFRDDFKGFQEEEKAMFLYGLTEWLHGDEKTGFETLVSLLKPYKLAKWTIITAFKTYFNPEFDVFIKPTTVKKIIRVLELDDMKYTPTPNYAFYKQYRTYLNEMKTLVDKRLSPNNPAFSGFLMMAMEMF